MSPFNLCVCLVESVRCVFIQQENCICIQFIIFCKMAVCLNPGRTISIPSPHLPPSLTPVISLSPFPNVPCMRSEAGDWVAISLCRFHALLFHHGTIFHCSFQISASFFPLTLAFEPQYFIIFHSIHLHLILFSFVSSCKPQTWLPLTL